MSAHKQQILYDHIVGEIRAEPQLAGSRLSPRHPRDVGAYESYSSILDVCYRTIWERPESSRLHRFHALIALWWMRGVPLPRIVQNQLKRNKGKDPRKVIRETLSLVEDHIRFRAVRVFTTYNALLALAYKEEGIAEKSDEIASIPLFLELGASDRTMISLMEIGLSRVAAVEIARRAPTRNLDAEEVRAWLSVMPIADLPSGVTRELQKFLEADINRILR